MGAILVRDLDQKTIERLKERARLNGRSLQQEIKGCQTGGGSSSDDGRSPTARD